MRRWDGTSPGEGSGPGEVEEIWVTCRLRELRVPFVPESHEVPDSVVSGYGISRSTRATPVPMGDIGTSTTLRGSPLRGTEGRSREEGDPGRGWGEKGT